MSEAKRVFNERDDELTSCAKLDSKPHSNPIRIINSFMSELSASSVSK